MTHALHMAGLTICHDGVTVLRDIDLQVRQGESLCLIGASGSGKSLIAAAIMGMLPSCMAASGSVGLGRHVVQAGDRSGLRAHWSQATCLLPQEPAAALAPLLRAAAQLRMPAAGRAGLGQAAAVECLARFGLDQQAGRQWPAALSGGMAQRLLASLTMQSPARLIVADEPTKGLDPERRAELVTILAGLRDAGRALLVITHDLAVARGLGGRIAVLEQGTIVEAGDTAALLDNPRSRFTRACLAADPTQWAPRQAGPAGPCVAAGERIVLARGRRRLVCPLDIEVPDGAITALSGPSGAGKSTLGDTLLGLIPAASGRITWLGHPADRSTVRRLRPRFQKLHQDPAEVFPSGRRIGDTLADLRRLPGGAEAVRAMPGLLERLGLSPAVLARRPHEVSGGEAQRLALARIVARRPALLVADEPSSRLDMPTQAAVLRLLRELVDEDGLAVLLITHDQAVARAQADTTIWLTPPV